MTVISRKILKNIHSVIIILKLQITRRISISILIYQSNYVTRHVRAWKTKTSKVWHIKWFQRWIIVANISIYSELDSFRISTAAWLIPRTRESNLFRLLQNTNKKISVCFHYIVLLYFGISTMFLILHSSLLTAQI